MSLQSIITSKLSICDINKTATTMGYISVDKLLSRTNKIISSPYLSLDISTYDFNSSTSEFIKRLCDALNIPPLLYDEIINDIEEDLRIQSAKFKPFIFLETNFKRNNQPVFLLAAVESKRYLKVDSEIAKLPLNEQLTHIQNIVTEHYHQHTELYLWGDVKQYVYFYSDSIVLVFSSSGELIDTVGEYNHSRATLSL